MNYQKGDIILVPVPFTNQRGTKRRPALVISNDYVHLTDDVLVVQITSQVQERYRKNNVNYSITSPTTIFFLKTIGQVSCQPDSLQSNLMATKCGQ